MSQPASSQSTTTVSRAEDARWFADEVHSHDAQLKAYLRGSFPTIRDVDDIAQESYVRVWRSRAKQTIRSAKGFLFQIARHVATDIVRRERVNPVQGVTDLAAFAVADPAPDGADAAVLCEEIALLADAIHSLPPRCREVFVLRKLHRMSQIEIAKQVGISEQTVEVMVYRGMRRCEAFLAKRGV